jgi:polar amino acid transport system substrate-binding protein
MKTRRSLISFAVALLSVGAIVGCGSSSSSSSSSGSSSSSTSSSVSSSATSSSSSAGADAAVAALVPSAIKSKGTIAVAADASYAPNEFIGPDGHTVIGMDADLSKALAGVMGLKANISNVTFDAIIPGLASGKYDLGASSFTDTKAREKVVHFVDYFSAGESFYTKASGGTSIAGIADICGKTVAVESTTTEQTDATAQSKKCKAAGKPAVTVLVFPNQNAANLALSSGRAQLGFADSPVAAYQVKKTNGQFKLVGSTFATAPYGLAIPKTSGLDKAVLAAVTVLIKNGSYTKILDKWGVQAGAIKAPKLNGATS